LVIEATQAAGVKQRTCEYRRFNGGERDTVKLTVGIVQTMLCQRTKSGKVCDEIQAMRFIKLCQARGLDPFEGDAFLLGYDTSDAGPQFSLVTAHQAFLKRAEVHKDYDGMESGVIVKRKVTLEDGAEGWETVELEGDYFDDGEKLVGGWAKVHFKHKRYPTYRRLRLATFNQGRSRWQKDPAGMIVKCAEADALRSSFPLALGGMYLEPEVVPADDRPAAKKEEAASGTRNLRAPASRPAEDLPQEAPADLDGEGAMARQDTCDDLSERIGRAESGADLEDCLKAILQQAGVLGEDLVKQLQAKVEERRGQL
jgi:phage recombination protein Bet